MSSVNMDINKIKAFVTAWYQALDLHVPAAELATFLADDVQMVFPEATLPTAADAVAWYAGGTYSNGTQAPGVINIFFDENHNVVSIDVVGGTPSEPQLRVVVAWQASWFEKPAIKSKRTSLDATQDWTIKASSKNQYGMVITKYNAVAAPFAYAPGFARL